MKWTLSGGVDGIEVEVKKATRGTLEVLANGKHLVYIDGYYGGPDALGGVEMRAYAGGVVTPPTWAITPRTMRVGNARGLRFAFRDIEKEERP